MKKSKSFLMPLVLPPEWEGQSQGSWAHGFPQCPGNILALMLVSQRAGVLVKEFVQSVANRLFGVVVKPCLYQLIKFRRNSIRQF
jgi:hypothetical protein